MVDLLERKKRRFTKSKTLSEKAYPFEASAKCKKNICLKDLSGDRYLLVS